MKIKCFYTLIALLLCLSSFAQTQQKKLHLFSDELKTAYPSVVYDFLERYLGEIENSTKGYTLNQKMADDKVAVCSGSLNNISKITPETPFSISKMDDKYYLVEWTNTDGAKLLELIFPIQYELLLGMPKVDIEKMMKQQLDSCSSEFEACILTDSLVELENNQFSTKPVYHYFVESLNTATYYSKTEENEFVPIYENSNKWYSAANLFQQVIANQDYTLFVQQNIYGFNQLEYTVKLTQWLNYCKANNLKVYFAIEEEREDGLKALLIAQSKDLGFNHMLSIIIPDNFIDKRNVVLKTQMNAYIPTQNIKELYQQYTKKPKKKI